MPIYEYVCEACGNEMEAMQRMSESPLVECPKCGKSALRKKISAPGFRLKGGGWYETDFKGGSKKNIAGESSSPASPPSSGGEAKSSSDKPASTSTSSGDK